MDRDVWRDRRCCVSKQDSGADVYIIRGEVGVIEKQVRRMGRAPIIAVGILYLVMHSLPETNCFLKFTEAVRLCGGFRLTPGGGLKQPGRLSVEMVLFPRGQLPEELTLLEKWR